MTTSFEDTFRVIGVQMSEAFKINRRIREFQKKYIVAMWTEMTEVSSDYKD